MTRSFRPPGPPRVLALAQLANSVGDGAFYACSALFFTRVVGLSATQVGLALTDRLGRRDAGRRAARPRSPTAGAPRRTAVLLAVATAARAAAFLVVRSFPLFVLVVCLYAAARAGWPPARQALLAGLVRRRRTGCGAGAPAVDAQRRAGGRRRAAAGSR